MANPTATRDHDRASSEISLKLRGGRPQRRLDLVCRIIDGETVILNREASILHRLNPTASFIWECCDGKSQIDAIVVRLADTFDVDPRVCRQDVDEMLSKLQSLNLLSK